MRLSPVLLLTLAAVACKKPEPPPAQVAAPGPGAMPPAAASVQGKVAERIDADIYSYLRLTTGSGEIWAAVPKTDVPAGTQVTVVNPMTMDGFESKTLKRKFDRIVFGTLAGQAPAGTMPPAGMPPPGLPPPGMPPSAMVVRGPGGPGPAELPATVQAQHAAAAAGPADTGDVKVEKAKGPDARTVAEVFGQRAALAGKSVTVRGKVVKFSAGIMGRNWVHLRDGSGGHGANDLTVTTADTVAVGDVVVAKGKVGVDRDFGAGYTYPVIVEGAKISK